MHSFARGCAHRFHHPMPQPALLLHQSATVLAPSVLSSPSLLPLDQDC
uniref:Uncharacterized protein n=1 Tax=Arundo donax TaxID=35708 RepID=A0A0A9DZ57_ARUDO